jgi:hypothetical protein
VFGPWRGCGGKSRSRRSIRYKRVLRVFHHYRDAFQANNNSVYGVSAVGYAYGHALSLRYSSTESVGYNPGYGARRDAGGVGMKREDDERSFSFSVREEEEEEEEEAEAEEDEEEKGDAKRRYSSERRWDGDRG